MTISKSKSSRLSSGKRKLALWRNDMVSLKENFVIMTMSIVLDSVFISCHACRLDKQRSCRLFATIKFQASSNRTSDTAASFFDLHLDVSNAIISAKIFNNDDDFEFEIINFPFFDDDVLLSTSYGVCIFNSWFARASSHVVDFNTRNKLLTEQTNFKLSSQLHKICKTIVIIYDQNSISLVSGTFGAQI